MDFIELDTQKVLSMVDTIVKNIKTLDKYEKVIEKKSKEIYKLTMSLKKKKYLHIGNSVDNLKFQLNIILNEKSYLENIKTIFIEKIYNDIYDLAESVILVVSSLDDINLEYDKNNEENIMKKVSTIKNTVKDKLNLKNILQLVTSLTNNINLIKNILHYFKDFINDTSNKIKNENLHCNSLEASLNNRT